MYNGLSITEVFCQTGIVKCGQFATYWLS